MKKKSIKATLKVLLLTIFYLPFLASMPSNSGSGIVPESSMRINAFTIAFLKQEAASGAQNLVASPVSAYSDLALSYVASRGDTRRALARAMHFPEDNETLEHDLNGLRRVFAGSEPGPGVDIQSAESVWLDGTYAQFSRQYLREIDRLGAGSAHVVSFGEKEKTSNEINAWVFQKTHGRIAGSVEPGDFQSRSQPGVIDEPGLVSVNAIYFRGEWKSRFVSRDTAKRTFYTSGGTGVEVPMMHQSSPFLYSENENFKFLEMPYEGSLYSMLVLLSKEHSDPQAMPAAVTPDVVVNLKKSAFPRLVDVLFPRFVIHGNGNVKSIPSNMGADLAFDRNKADFQGMIVPRLEASRVYLSSVRHDVWMEVGEEGTEASAVTASVHYTVGCSAEEPPMPAEFHADHPFLYFIVNDSSRSILFAGWIGNPAELEK